MYLPVVELCLGRQYHAWYESTTSGFLVLVMAILSGNLTLQSRTVSFKHILLKIVFFVFGRKKIFLSVLSFLICLICRELAFSLLKLRPLLRNKCSSASVISQWWHHCPLAVWQVLVPCWVHHVIRHSHHPVVCVTALPNPHPLWTIFEVTSRTTTFKDVRSGAFVCCDFSLECLWAIWNLST